MGQLIEKIVEVTARVALAAWEYFGAKDEAQRAAARKKADAAVTDCFDFVDKHLLDQNAIVDAEVRNKFGGDPK